VSHLSSSLEHFGLHQASVKHLLLLEVSLGNVCEGPLHLRKERTKLVDREKWLKETHLGVGPVCNSIFLNENVGIMGW
jgi:hypothetical protein